MALLPFGFIKALPFVSRAGAAILPRAGASNAMALPCSLGKPQDDWNGEERRIALDGMPYTGLEFMEYYGENWNACWQEASIATAGGAPHLAAAAMTNSNENCELREDRSIGEAGSSTPAQKATSTRASGDFEGPPQSRQPHDAGASQPSAGPPGRAIKVQLITCGVGAECAGLSDTRDRLREVGFDESVHGERLVNGLDEYIRYYAQIAKMFKLARKPAIHLDARVFSDPAKDDLKRHTGRHREIIARMVAHPEFAWWIHNAHRTFIQASTNWSSGTILPAVVFCRSGRHRAVAASEILRGVLAWVEGWEFAPTIHMTIDVERAGCTCAKCHRDRLICDSIQSSLASAVAVLEIRDGCAGGSGSQSLPSSLKRAASGA